MSSVRPTGATVLSVFLGLYSLAMLAAFAIGLLRNPEGFAAPFVALAAVVTILAASSSVGVWKLSRWSKTSFLLFAGSILCVNGVDLYRSSTVLDEFLWIGLSIGTVLFLLVIALLYRYLDRVTRPAA